MQVQTIVITTDGDEAIADSLFDIIAEANPFGHHRFIMDVLETEVDDDYFDVFEDEEE